MFKKMQPLYIRATTFYGYKIAGLKSVLLSLRVQTSFICQFEVYALYTTDAVFAAHAYLCRCLDYSSAPGLNT